MHHSFRNTQYLRLNGKAWLKQLLSPNRRKDAHDSCGSSHDLWSHGSCPPQTAAIVTGHLCPESGGRWPM